MSAPDDTRDASTADELLRRIESVTDIALAHLGVEDLLVELLERTQGLLDADTAAVLLLDPSGEYLVATERPRSASLQLANRGAGRQDPPSPESYNNGS